MTTIPRERLLEVEIELHRFERETRRRTRRIGILLLLIVITSVALTVHNALMNYEYRPSPRGGVSCSGDSRISALAMNPFASLSQRCVLTGNALMARHVDTDSAAPHRLERQHWSYISVMLPLLAAIFILGLLASGWRASKMLLADRLQVFGIKVMFAAYAIATLIAALLVVETQPVVGQSWWNSEMISGANLALTTWNPLLQLLLFSVAPIGLGITLFGFGIDHSRRGREIRRITIWSMAGTLCFVSAAQIFYPHLVSAILLALGLTLGYALLVWIGFRYLKVPSSTV